MSAPPFRLRVCSGPDVGRELLVEGSDLAPVSIGREGRPATDLICTDDKVSRRHAAIVAFRGGWLITDLGSTNGTRLNGLLLQPKERAALHDGDQILVGLDTVVTFEAVRHQAADALARPPREEFGHYAVYGILGRGPADRVDVAVNRLTNARVALKRFTPHLTGPVRRRILAQAERAKTWQHPNIAAVFDAGEEGDVLYIASYLVEGVTLESLQRHRARDFDVVLATYLTCQTCSALSYAQLGYRDFVHRNLSPRTIMVSHAGAVVLIDFGFTPLEALRDSTVKLSRDRARYLAPEHRARRGLEPRSDVYSLGIILYELLTGEPIDPRHSAALENVADRCPDVPPDLAALTMRATALRPEDRFTAALDMEAELGTILRRLAREYGPPEVAAWLATPPKIV